MLRSSLTTMGVVLLGTTALAQSDLSSRLHPITAPIKQAGTLHLATGTWTRPETSGQALGPASEVIVYANTCNTGYYAGQDPAGGETFFDEGTLPRTDQLTAANLADSCKNNTAAGCANSYLITGFQFSYCTYQTSYSAKIDFASNYEFGSAPAGSFPCNPVFIPVATFTPCLPASATLGTQACWLIGIDLTGTTSTFTLNGHSPTTAGTTDSFFGWKYTTLSAGTAATPDGPIIAGDLSTCSGTDATRWDRVNGCATPGTSTPYYPANYSVNGQSAPTNPANCTPLAFTLPLANEEGTGMLTFDAFRIEGSTTAPVTAPGCYFFGGPGNPLGSFHLELYSDVTPCPEPPIGTAIAACTGQANCPCAFPGGNADSGCQIEPALGINGGAKLVMTGNASISADTAATGSTGNPGGTVLITVTNMVPLTPATIFLQGSTVISPVPFYDGNRCVAGNLNRLNGQPITSPPFVSAGDSNLADGSNTYPTGKHFHSISQRMDPTFLITSNLLPNQPATPYHYFAVYRTNVPAQVCNVSLGGQLNTTNAVTLVWAP